MPCVVCEAILESIFGKSNAEAGAKVGPNNHNNRNQIEVKEIDLQIIRADGLAVKDSIMGLIPTSSDPYIEVRLYPHGDATQNGKIQFLGKTPVVQQNLSPEYGMPFETSVPVSTLHPDAYLLLTIMDWDEHNEDDLMGRVKVPIRPETTRRLETKWYDVPPDSADGDIATGRVEITLETKKVVKNKA